MRKLAAPKTVTPNRNMRRRPKMSPSRPPVTSSTAKVSVYALTVHSSAEVVACRPRWIEGSATFTTVLSSMIMNSAKHIAPSGHQRAQRLHLREGDLEFGDRVERSERRLAHQVAHQRVRIARQLIACRSRCFWGRRDCLHARKYRCDAIVACVTLITLARSPCA